MSTALSLPPGASFTPMLDNSLNAFVVADTQGRYVYTSKSTSNLFQLPRESLLGRSIQEFLHPHDVPALVSLVRYAMDNASPAPTETMNSHAPLARLLHKTGAGGYLPVEAKACCDGTFVYIVMLDASVPANLETLLPEYLLSTCHDLRTPVTSIQSSVAMLRRILTDDESASLLKGITASCSVLNGVLNNVLLLKELKRGRVVVKQSVFSPLQAIRGVLDTLAAVSGAAAIRWIDGGAALPPAVQTDAANFVIVLRNALIAALRFALPSCGPEKVRLHTRCEPLAASTDGGRALVLYLDADSPGRALTPPETDAVLAPFGMAPSEKGGGTGLSLSVARGVARVLGGDLRIDTSAEGGTRIHVSLPLKPITSLGDKPGSPPPKLALPEPTSPGGEAPPSPVGAAAPRVAPIPPAAQLEMNTRMWEYLLHNSDDIFAICRIGDGTHDGSIPTLTVAYVSPNVTRRFRFKPQDMIGRSFADFCHTDDRNTLARAIASALAGEHHVLCSHRAVTSETGTFVWCETAGYSESQWFYFVCRDIRTRKAVELTLRAFTMATSHDLREPANAIVSSTAVLDRSVTVMGSPEALTLMAGIRSACGLLLGALSNVLSVPEVDKIPLASSMGEERHLEIINIAEVALEVIQTCRTGCPGASAGILFEANVIPPLIEADRHRIGQVLQNLIVNALKFGEGKPVRVRVSVDRAPAGGGGGGGGGGSSSAADAGGAAQLHLTVTDKGRGLTDEEQKSIFSAWEASAPAMGGGNGLGLFIADSFAKLMGGVLKVASQPATVKGASFTLNVPVRVLNEEESDTALAAMRAAAEQRTTYEEADTGDVSPPKGGRMLRALFADDSPLSLKIVSRLLRINGFSVTPVADGQAALDALKAGADEIDVAILDTEMPLMTGPEVSAAYHAWAAAERPDMPTIPIAALTADASSEKANASKAAGMDTFLLKPLRSDGIASLRELAAEYAMDRRLARQVPGSTAQARDAVEAARHPKRGAAGGAGPSAPPSKRPERQEPPERRESSSS